LFTKASQYPVEQCVIGYLYNGFWKFNFETWENTTYWGPDDSVDSGDPRRLKSMSVTYHAQDPTSNIPLPVLFINQGEAVVVGSTKGCALILESKRAEKIQALKHGNDRTWVTALAYVELPGYRRIIATGDGNRGKQTRIILWAEEKKNSSFKFLEFWNTMRSTSLYLLTVMQVVFIFLGVISVLLWLYPALWSEVIRLVDFRKTFSGFSFSLNLIPVFPFPNHSSATIPTATVTIPTGTTPPAAIPQATIPTATPVPYKAKFTKIFEAFEDLLVCVNFLIGMTGHG
ncbi:hypothetical protein F5878DRAFT_645068, partial [Lentinula raphanica]